MKKEIIWPEETKKAITLLLMVKPELHEYFKKRASSHDVEVKELIELWLLQERKCGLCGDILKMDKSTHIDHIIPKSQNGKNNIKNYQLVCSKCNYSKRDLTTRDFLLLCLKVSANNQSKFISKEEKMAILEEKWKRENRERVARNNGEKKNIVKLEYLLGKKIKSKNFNNKDNNYFENLLASAGLI